MIRDIGIINSEARKPGGMSESGVINSEAGKPGNSLAGAYA
jgi:hypothetical protein